MIKQINLSGSKVTCEIKKNCRAKRIGITVFPGGKLKLTVPWPVSIKRAEAFLSENASWVLKNLAKAKLLPKASRKRDEYKKIKHSAEEIIKKRVFEINQFYKFNFGRIAIRNQGTLWGSCSSNGNLNFNYKLALLPRKYTDYVIIHELCHLREMNHSQRFWNLVEKKVPDYKIIRKELRKLSIF